MADRTSLFQTLCRRWTGLGALASVLAVVMGACGDSSEMTGPTSNAPPTIQSLVVGASQVEADREVQLTATVTDAETAPGQLKYEWSTTPAGGTFIGTGSLVKWKAPVGATTPGTYTITLTVTESYFSGNTTKENRVSSTTQVRYSDAVREITGLVSQFLRDFATFSVSPQLCVQNFSDTLCSAGKSAELSEITGNRNRLGVQIESVVFSLPSVTLNGARTSAQIATQCSFRDRFSNGTHQTNSGTCNLTAVYENFRWFLCTSEFKEPFTTTTNSLDAPYTTTTHGVAPRFSHP